MWTTTFERFKNCILTRNNERTKKRELKKKKSY